MKASVRLVKVCDVLYETLGVSCKWVMCSTVEIWKFWIDFGRVRTRDRAVFMDFVRQYSGFGSVFVAIFTSERQWEGS